MDHQNIATTKVVPWHKPSFLRIMMVVHRSMLERSIVITGLNMVCKTPRMVRESSSYQEQSVGRDSGCQEEAVEYHFFTISVNPRVVYFVPCSKYIVFKIVSIHQFLGCCSVNCHPKMDYLVTDQ